VEIRRQNAGNPPITLVGSKIRTRTDPFQLVGDKERISVNQFPAERSEEEN